METDKPGGKLWIRGGNLVAFLLSLLLSLIVWGVMEFSDRYRYVFHYTVQIYSPLEGRVFTSTSRDMLAVRGASTGFFLLRHKYSVKNGTNVLSFRIDPSMLQPSDREEDVFWLPTSALADKVSESMAGKLVVEEVVDDTLFFLMPRNLQKKVPVCISSDITYSDQYMPVERLVVRPDSVWIAGDEDIVSAIDSVFTEKIYAKNIKDNIQGEAAILPINGVEMSSDQIVYRLKVERYVEDELSIPIQVQNLPPDVRMVLFPSEVKIVFREEYGSSREFTEDDFDAYVDYNQAAAASSGKAKIKLNKVPAGVLRYSLVPEFADRVIFMSKKDER